MWTVSNRLPAVVCIATLEISAKVSKFSLQMCYIDISFFET